MRLLWWGRGTVFPLVLGMPLSGNRKPATYQPDELASFLLEVMQTLNPENAAVLGWPCRKFVWIIEG